MNKIDKALKCLSAIVDRPSRLMRVLDDDYWGEKCGHKRLPNIDVSLNETICPHSLLEGGALPNDLALLKSLARQYDHCSYLEIGTWRGESVANVASVADECVSLSLSAKEMKDLNLSDNVIQNYAFFSKSLKNVTHLGHNSLTFDFTSLGKKFDLIFIDGDHFYEAVKSDTENAFKLLRNESSIIVWHDYGWGTESVRWEVLRGILDGSPSDTHAHVYHVANTMCAVYANGVFEQSCLGDCVIPTKTFTITIKDNSY